MKNNVIIGLLCCLSGLILLHRNLIVLGLPLFLIGFYVMNRK